MPREGALSHKQIQRRADEETQQSLREVADQLDQIAADWRPDAVVLAGETQGRNKLHDELSEALQEIAQQTEHGGTDDDAAEEALAEELRLIASDVADVRSQELTKRYAHARAHDYAVEGSEWVVRAAEMGAVETLLFEHNRAATEEAKVPAPASKLMPAWGCLAATLKMVLPPCCDLKHQTNSRSNEAYMTTCNAIRASNVLQGADFSATRSLFVEDALVWYTEY